ncbi:MAG: group II intron reverse transcriptase/maturase, partial [Acidobacteria bacterium]|nr:group II intron reverse transcriptase/maturase [Acidobacteriota bacterium]
HPDASARWLLSHKGHRSGHRQKLWRTVVAEQFLTASLPVRRFQRGWMRTPDYAQAVGEPDA